jgi:hypothetical protein
MPLLFLYDSLQSCVTAVRILEKINIHPQQQTHATNTRNQKQQTTTMNQQQAIVQQFYNEILPNLMRKNGLGEVGFTYYDTCQVYKYCPPSQHNLTTFLQWLVKQQKTDGGWHVETERIDFRLIATLAALTLLIKNNEHGDYEQVINHAKQYCVDNKGCLENFSDLGDMAVAFELIVVKLIEEIDFGSELTLSKELVGQYKKYRYALSNKSHYKDKYLHCIEAWHSGQVSNDWLKPNGSVVCTPSATAYWIHQKIQESELTTQDLQLIEDAKVYLQQSQVLVEQDTVVLYPNAYPMPNFDVSFTLQFMMLSGLSKEPSIQPLYVQWCQKLHEMVGDKPICIYKDYFPADCDDTACCYSVFVDQKLPFNAKNIEIFDKESYFITFEDEFQTSISATCRAVFLYQQMGRDVSKYQQYIVSKQHKDGYWRDKWHLSRLYTTFLSTLVLDSVEHEESLRRAVRYIVHSQTEEGGWHGYNSNACESAEAIFCLHNYLSRSNNNNVEMKEEILECMEKAKKYFNSNTTAVPTLWIDKDGYSMPVLDKAITLCAKYILSSHY